MDTDPILRLQNKIEIMKRQRDQLERDIKRDEDDIEKLNKQVETKKENTINREQKVADNTTKIKTLDALITETEKSIQKIIETSLTLDKALEQGIK